jgi:predicted acetyltransferase
VHDDIDRRGEPVASLFASEGAIYERIGYGMSTQVRVTSIDARAARVRSEFAQPAGSVSFLDEEDAAPVLAEIWERFRRQRAGETARTVADQQFLIDRRSTPDGSQAPAIYLAHADGYAAYRVEQRWNDGHPAHRLNLLEMATATPDAHAALWQTLLSIDLIGTITAQCLPLDDPLPYLLENPRMLRTTGLNDGVWVNVRDIPMAFSARAYRTAQRIVVESNGRRWAIEGGPDGGSCSPVRTKPDLVTNHAGLSSLLYGGVLPSSLIGARRMTARSADAVARADVFFTTSLRPHCQDRY